MRASLLAGALGVLALSCACEDESGGGRAPGPVHAATPAKFVPPPGFTRLRISSTPHLDPETLKAALAPFAAYLSAGLSVPVEVSVAVSYDDLGTQLARGEVDLAQFSPYSYVRAAKKVALHPLVTVISDGSASAAGYVVVKADGPFHRLEDLQGRSFAFIDPASTSGYLYPVKLLRDRGLDPKTFFSHTDFLVHHDAALLAVHEGRFDATATYQGALPALQKAKGIDPLSFRIIAKTPRTPRDIFCTRQGLPEEVVAQLRALLLDVSVRTPAGRAALRPLNVNGFVVADDHAYDFVREVAAEVFDGGSR
ncbi:MAG: phosphate/phosphite/phosphonate ABC transporter substrate-binding protein [Myxococcaceae bacterium]